MQPVPAALLHPAAPVAHPDLQPAGGAPAVPAASCQQAPGQLGSSFPRQSEDLLPTTEAPRGHFCQDSLMRSSLTAQHSTAQHSTAQHSTALGNRHLQEAAEVTPSGPGTPTRDP